MRRGALAAIAAIGVGLALAPAAFGMFTRAPLGGEMIDDFRPFMTDERLTGFETHLNRIGAAVETLRRRDVDLGDTPLVAALERDWDTIDADMSGMLDDIRANLDNFAAVDALPDFPLFPWFFVAPGLILAGLAGAGLRRGGTGTDAAPGLSGALRWPLVAVGLGLVAAPLVFGMFTRAPMGADMIDDFRPLMTRERITEVQRAFLTIGGAEGELRSTLLPALDGTQARNADLHAFVERWPDIAADMAPMIGAMADNLDNYAAVDALPPFDLFPWFFVIPGLLVAGLALLPPGAKESEMTTEPEPAPTGTRSTS